MNLPTTLTPQLRSSPGRIAFMPATVLCRFAVAATPGDVSLFAAPARGDAGEDRR